LSKELEKSCCDKNAQGVETRDRWARQWIVCWSRVEAIHRLARLSPLSLRRVTKAFEVGSTTCLSRLAWSLSDLPACLSHLSWSLSDVSRSLSDVSRSLSAFSRDVCKPLSFLSLILVSL